MVRVIMHGCNGRMGQVITEMIAKEAEMEIVAGVDVSDSVHNTYPVFKTLKDCDVEADVVIDFANAKAVDGLLDTCVAKEIFPVCFAPPDFRKNSLRMSKRLPARLRSCALQICPWASTF